MEEAEVVTAPMADTAPMTMDAHALQDHAVSVGGVVEFIAANTDTDENVDGFDRGRFSRIIVDYSSTLDTGLQVSGQLSYMLNNRDGSERAWAPDTMFLSVGGGFGTVSMGSHAMALCSLHTRTVGLVPNGWNFGHLGVGFTGTGYDGWFAEDNYCGTPTGVSYATPSMGGIAAMVSYAPNQGADQWNNRRDADTDAAENRLEAVVRYSADMGGANIALAAGMQTAEDDAMDSQVVGAQVQLGGIVVGADWFDNADADGFNLGAKYTIGSISPGIVFSSADYDDGREAEYLTVGASYQVGGGVSVYAEYHDYDTGNNDTNSEVSAVIAGVTIAF